MRQYIQLTSALQIYILDWYKLLGRTHLKGRLLISLNELCTFTTETFSQPSMRINLLTL